MQVLNFYSTVFADQMKRGRKTATIRLGDKRDKYRKNQMVCVTVGYQYSPREKLFDAVVDNVEVKRIKELSPEGGLEIPPGTESCPPSRYVQRELMQH